MKIIYQSENVLILNKPAGILVQPDIANGDSIVTRAKDLFNNAFAVHRLDRNTTGVLVVALHGDSLRALEKLFKERSVKKFYIAVRLFPIEVLVHSNILQILLHLRFPIMVLSALLYFLTLRYSL